MKKKVKYYSELFKQEFTVIVDENLKKPPITGFAARKLKEANEILKKTKLPKV